jgi:hypothetical protein
LFARSNPGRWAIRFAHIIGGGVGDVRLARIQACGEPE